MGDDDAQTRHQLAILCRRKKARTSQWSPERPTEWQPTSVTDPRSGVPFTDAGAWDFVAKKLDDGIPLEHVILKKPPGAKAYVLLIPLVDRILYVKLQLGPGAVIGRSFHYSIDSDKHPRGAQR